MKNLKRLIRDIVVRYFDEEADEGYDTREDWAEDYEDIYNLPKK